MSMQANTATGASTLNPFAMVKSELARAQLVAVAFAGVMLFVVGFAQATPLHNAAHDTRHIQIFPCH